MDFIQQLVGAVVWVMAVVVYIDLRRRGRHGFTRFIAFWAGMPVTFLSMFAVKEGSQPDIPAPPDDDQALLAEIRRERRGDRTLESPDTPSADADHRGAQEGT